MAGIDELLRIMARLRDPARGCPWDLAQDFASISPHTIEEAYEVDEAIACGDLAALRDELGDLLFQVVFQARLAQEQGAFDFEGVVDSVCEKLIRRHPHIFAGAPSPESASAQVANWEAIKATERAAAAPDDGSPPDPFAGIPRALPALMRSAKIAGRLARTGDSGTATGGAADSAARGPTPGIRSAAVARVDAVARRAAAHVAASTALDHAASRIADVPVSSGPAAGGPSRAERLALVGEGIRAWVELARQLGVDPEQALRLRDDEAIAAARRDVHQAGNGRHR